MALLNACGTTETVTETLTKTVTGGVSTQTVTTTVSGAGGSTVTATKTVPTTVATTVTAPPVTVTQTAAIPTITMTVNGGKYTLNVIKANTTLRETLRDELGFTSVKDMCLGEGACGSCSVIVNKRPVLSCLTLLSECNGAVVETAEGIAAAKHPIIDAYILNYVMQCGYCIPGFVVTAKALIDDKPKPTEADIREALGGNICR